jgi:hypothetical protein
MPTVALDEAESYEQGHRLIRRSSVCTTGQTASGTCLIVEARYERMIMCSAVATTSVAPERSPIQLDRSVVRPNATVTAEAPAAVVATGRSRRMLGWLEDAGLLLLLALTVPLVVLAVGTPVALFVRLLIAIGRRWW